MAKRRYPYDIVILGGGSAGIVSGVVAGALGMRVLLIEKRRMGGECLNTGCVPSKALLHAAKVAHTIRTASDVGMAPKTLAREEAAGVLRHVRETIGAVEEADATTRLLRDQGVEIRFGDAHFADARTLVLDGEHLQAANFILATGSHPALPDIPGLNEGDYLTNRTIFDLDMIPESLLVIGGGPNGVEMAQAFQRLGSRVTLVQKGERLLPRDDSELTEQLEDCLRAEGIDIRLRAAVRSVRRGYVATIQASRSGPENGEAGEVTCERIFAAVGRRANVDGLNLEAAGVVHDGQRIQTNADLRTTAPNIYACGDLLGEYQFSHMAEYEAKIVVRNIVFPGRSARSFRVDPWATFTDPELAHVGLTEDEARVQGLDFEVYRQPFAQNDRALTDNEAKGQVKVLTQGIGGRILGAHILGPCASEILHEWILAMANGHSVRDVADMIHIYPTLSMACQHAAQRWYERKALEPLVARALDTYVQTIRPRQTTLALGALGIALCGAGIGIARKLAGRNGSRPPDL